MKPNQLFHQLKLNVKFTILIIVMLVIPIGVFAGILFYLMEQNVVDENRNYMQYTMERSQDDIATKIDSINMPTQFFLSDDDLKEALLAAASGQQLSTEEWLSLKKNDISSLERLVNNNPLLYSVRVYAINDDVQEMMPILYNHTRMERLAWADDTESGWKFNYVDAVFDSYTMNQSQKLISLVTPIVDYDYGVIGTVEAAMTMQDMFPGLYENIENEWSCFVTDEGELYFGDNEQDDSVELLQEILKQNQKTEETQVVYSKIKGRKLVISSMPVKELSGTLISVKDITENVHRVYFIRNTFVVVMLFVIALLVLWVNHIVKRLLRQLYDILASIREVQKGNLDVVIENCGSDEMGELGTQINKMLRRIKRLMEDNLKREMLMKNSEIRALQNQINAHFIYNVLESIKMMAEIDEEYAISDAVTSLGKLLRYSMKWVSGNVLVEQELEYIKNYMALINLRFDYEIYLSLNIPDSILKQEIPKMSLQPIVENAIYHGIEQMAEDTNIYIKGFVEGNDCVIEITDAGKGMTEEEVEQLKKKITGEMESDGGSGNGIGLKNVQDRIQIAFGEKYGIEVASKLGCYTKIRVRIPWHPVYEETVKVGEQCEERTDCRR